MYNTNMIDSSPILSPEIFKNFSIPQGFKNTSMIA